MSEEFTRLTGEYDAMKERFIASEPELRDTIIKVHEILKDLEGRPGKRMYMDLPPESLLDYEFRLARLNEFLATKSAEIEGKYNYFHDKYKQKYLISYRENKKQLSMNGEKVTVSDIDSVTTEELVEFQDKVNVIYEYSRYTKSLVESIGQFLIAITHRVKNSQSEKAYSRDL